MRRISEEIVNQIQAFATLHPEASYLEIAAKFQISVISVKRYCAKLGRSKGWRQGRRSGNSDPEQFWSRIGRAGPDECWPWGGSLNNSGYGFLSWNGENKAAHRVAYEIAKGPIPQGMDIDHECRNRQCCNPNHLHAVTHLDNMKRTGRLPNIELAFDAARARCVDCPHAIDTAPSAPFNDAEDGSLHIVKGTSIRPRAIDTGAPEAAVSMEESLSGTTQLKPTGKVSVDLAKALYHQSVVLQNGDVFVVVSHDCSDAIAMIENITGPGSVLRCDAIPRRGVLGFEDRMATVVALAARCIGRDEYGQTPRDRAESYYVARISDSERTSFEKTDRPLCIFRFDDRQQCLACYPGGPFFFYQTAVATNGDTFAMFSRARHMDLIEAHEDTPGPATSWSHPCTW